MTYDTYITYITMTHTVEGYVKQPKYLWKSKNVFFYQIFSLISSSSLSLKLIKWLATCNFRLAQFK